MKKRVKLLYLFAELALLILFVLHISSVAQGIQKALVLCATSIIPSLFVFLILSDCIASLLLASRRISPKWTIFLLGNLCGFPAGAVACSRYTGACASDPKKLSALLAFCNNASPAFLFGAIGNALFADKRIGLLLFVAQFSVSFFGTLLTQVTVTAFSSAQDADFSFFCVLEKAIQSILRICALICLFSAVLSVCRIYVSPSVFAFLSAILEIGNGTAMASTLPTPFAIALCGFACGWSGICVHMQIFSAAKSMKVNKIRFVFCKFIQGVFTAVLSFAGYKLFFLLKF